MNRCSLKRVSCFPLEFPMFAERVANGLVSKGSNINILSSTTSTIFLTALEFSLGSLEYPSFSFSASEEVSEPSPRKDLFSCFLVRCDSSSAVNGLTRTATATEDCMEAM
ncbi:hypothetical protein WICPIJ_006673 [Wickerhamomyces pijperi]|uniref:Uncharacterized protein n=1 Tax=Wickerhamomyces pijperi TaxID=599730 RepID=A0A9P8Q3T9_WICPI|nr:hypothetical protein WICPIJ_006673 [Wickerhamomyces pijperi]